MSAIGPAPRPGITPWLALPVVALMFAVWNTEPPVKTVILVVQYAIVAVQIMLLVRFRRASWRWRRALRDSSTGGAS